MTLTIPLDRPLVDLRCYTIVPRKMPQFLDVFDRLAMPVLIECIGQPLGIYTSYVGALNQMVHLWAYKDMADYEARGRARDNHADWPQYLKASEGLIHAQEDRLIRLCELPSLIKQNSGERR